MGFNISITRKGPISDVPLSLRFNQDEPGQFSEDGYSLLPSFYSNREFATLLKQHNTYNGECPCFGDRLKHKYECVDVYWWRPQNFAGFRAAIAHLEDQERWQELLTFLERNPNAWLEFD